MCVLDYTGLKQLIEKGVYNNNLPFPRMDETTKEGYITDENKSVKWNREQIEKNKEAVKLAHMKYHSKETELYNKFKSDVTDYIQNFYSYTKEQADYIFSKGWEEGHADGILTVLEYVQDILDFTKEFTKLSNTNN